jgi:hypothetical protein
LRQRKIPTRVKDIESIYREDVSHEFFTSNDEGTAAPHWRDGKKRCHFDDHDVIVHVLLYLEMGLLAPAESDGGPRRKT